MKALLPFARPALAPYPARTTLAAYPEHAARPARTAAARTAAAIAAIASVVLALAPLVAGCVPTSKSTIGDPSKARFDADLAGIWRLEPKKNSSPDEGPYYAVFAPRERVITTADGETTQSEIEATMFSSRGGKKGLDLSLFRGKTTRSGERRFLSITPLMMDSDPADAGKPDAAYFLLCYEVTGGKVRMGLAKVEPLLKAVEAGKLKGTAKRETIPSVALTDTPEALAAYFGAGKVEDHFDMELTLVRVEAGPPPAAPAKKE